ncbi:hypothetical protein EJK48_1979 [Moraxella catarrhalis]|uniref:Uncharacterized protein n=1 Tax=Moraxella catarrhalis TaxID=480 RepID=A0A3S9QH26_MORCA|nr:hypothetical protein EJK53_2143 [Moraxella catarrhalis]AZQ94702.1 hypothetical protein EJK48_1979 [Moraxella catarrhalis]RUO13986.1 hypothetical protein EJK49_1104 [Moraxella catarrhalis]
MPTKNNPQATNGKSIDQMGKPNRVFDAIQAPYDNDTCR